MTERRPLGLPAFAFAFSEPAEGAEPADLPAAGAPAGDSRRPLPIGRPAFQSPPSDAVEPVPPARRSLALGGMVFSDPVN
ncbi:hypothetical protein [Streptacidiphilus sp. PAMC 29251]